MALEQRGTEIRHDMVDIAARYQSALERWSGHAEVLHRISLIDEGKFRERLKHPDV